MKKLFLLTLLPFTLYATNFTSETGVGTAYESPRNMQSIQTYHKSVVSTEYNEFRFRTDGRFNIANGQVSAGQSILEAGYDRTLTKDWKLFTVSDLYYNMFNNINNVYLLGGGAKYYIINNDSFKFDTSLAAVYNRQSDQNKVVTESASFSFRNRFFYTFGDNRIMLQYFYVQPTQNNNPIHTAILDYIYTYKPQLKFKIGSQYNYATLTDSYLASVYGLVIFSL